MSDASIGQIYRVLLEVHREALELVEGGSGFDLRQRVGIHVIRLAQVDVRVAVGDHVLHELLPAPEVLRLAARPHVLG